jgi:hypothetical protein
MANDLRVRTSPRCTPVLMALAAYGCTLGGTNPPPVSGPSELGLAIALEVVPDILVQDGVSQASISVSARDPTGRAVSGLPLWVDVMVGGEPQEVGRLSERQIETNADGRVAFIYTAPEAAQGTTTSTLVTLAVTPLTGDARGHVPRTVDIRLVPPPLDSPTACSTRESVLAFVSRLIAVAAHPCAVAGRFPCRRVPA